MYDLEGYDLATHIEPGDYTRVVACLNIWNDAPELDANLWTWFEHVDHIIAIDGAYDGVPIDVPYSTDGTLELLESVQAEIVRTDEFWPDQNVKRTEYLKRCQPGDLIWQIDADEVYENAEAVRDAPRLDVGWIRYTSPIYLRPQWIPRLWAYRENLEIRTRHHWTYAGNQLVSTNQRGGSGYIHRQVPVRFHNTRGARRPQIRQVRAGFHRVQQVQEDTRAAPERAVGHEPLRVLQVGPFDPGGVIYRLHAGINTTSPHTSVMSTATREWPEWPYQLDHGDEDYEAVARMKPDVAHYHVHYDGAPPIESRWTVMHHHGTELRLRTDELTAQDKERADVRLVSNLELLSYGDDMVWLPNPVPVAEYQRLAEYKPNWKHGTLIVAHSPTKRANKGTDDYLKAIDICRGKGLDIRANLTHKIPHAATLELKARSHVVFDSFWLGMQCSGLEGAAMGLPVIAGDPNVQAQYLSFREREPYTYANDVQQLVEQLERLATDEAYYRQEADEVYTYTLETHDTANVVHRYLEILDERLHWRDTLTMGTP